MKRNIIQFMVIGAMATAMLASCNKNKETEANVPENGFLATVEQIGDNGNNGSRTHINPENWDDGTTWPVMWTEGDQIVVYNGSELRVFQLQSGENSNNGIFEPADGQDYDYTSGPFSAVYCPDIVEVVPYLTEPEDLELFFSGTTALVEVPQYQTYKANSFAEGAMPMAAYGDGQTLEFKNLAGGLCFPIVGAAGANIKEVVVESLSTNDAVTGVFNVDCADATHSLTPFINSGYSMTDSYVVLDCSEGVTLDATNPTYFTIMVAPGSLENGFNVTAYDAGHHVVYQNTVDWSANPHEGFITRGVIRKVNQNLEAVVPPLAVTTISPTFITTNSALGLGAVDDTPATCGILYALASDLATPADDLVIGGTNVTNLSGTAGTRFDASLTGLAEDQIYYVRAYATNEEGTVSYGDPVPFATRYDYYSAANKGKSRSVFTVDENNTRVRFSMGNLQYIGSAGSGSADDNNAGAYWKFADYQFDYLGYNGQGSAAIKQDRDLFGWGTSGINDYTPIATCWQPWSNSTTDHTQYNPYGSTSTNLNSDPGKADWGYNAISNGGNTLNSGWRTLQGGTNGGNTNEWDYLLNTRTCGYHRYAHVRLTLKGTSGMSYTTVNQVPACGTPVNGMIVFPDSFTWPAIVNALTTLDAPSGFLVNRLTEAQWSLLEQAGAVFLPAAGDRSGTSVEYLGSYGLYWSSTYADHIGAYDLNFSSGPLLTQSYSYRCFGFSVRLACPAE